MKKDSIQIISLLIILVFAVWYFFLSDRREDVPSQQVGTESLQAKTNDEGPVTIEVTPESLLKESAGQWKFKVILDTHSIELVDDLTKNSTLVDANGNEYQSIAWEGDPPGGHHREGFLVFNPILPRPKSITLQIKNVGDVMKRDFVWQLN